MAQTDQGRRRILVIAGSDSSGGAGLEADQKVIASYGCYAMTATTALTAQNTHGVQDVHHTPPEFVRKQIDACLDDIGADVVKTGMLASAETVSIVAASFVKHKITTSVVDPVMVSTSGHQLLPEAAVKTLRKELLPLTTILTPNIPEAQLLLRDAGQESPPIKTIADLISTARAILSLGPQHVLLKGGHVPLTADGTVTVPSSTSSTAATAHEVVDIFVSAVSPDDPLVLETPYISSRNTHGTGCSLASAIASNLALGNSPARAAQLATRYISAAIRSARGDLGTGHGPINHFHSTYTLPFSPGHFVEYLLARPDVAPAWHAHTHHSFVSQLALGTLPAAAFRYYLVQDYLYLVQFARANALGGYKASTLEGVAAAARIVGHIERETALHVGYCARLGIGRRELLAAAEHPACTAYTRYVLDVGLAQDWLALQVAFAPCLLGYGAIAARLADAQDTVRGEQNPYWEWIENYTAPDYVEAVDVGRALLEEHALRQSPARIEELVGVFVHATRMETLFWEMGEGEGRRALG